jgi:hypothetical protein
MCWIGCIGEYRMCWRSTKNDRFDVQFLYKAMRGLIHKKHKIHKINANFGCICEAYICLNISMAIK